MNRKVELSLEEADIIYKALQKAMELMTEELVTEAFNIIEQAGMDDSASQD